MATRVSQDKVSPLPSQQGAESIIGGAQLNRRRRRKSSILGSDPRGDTGAPALSTLFNERSLHNKSELSEPAARQKRPPSIFKRWKSISLRHTWLNPLIICLTVVAIYLANPSPSNPVYPALFVSYPIPRSDNADPTEPIQYGKGRMDFVFVAFYTIFLSFTREFITQRLLRPLAIHWGIRSRGKQARIMEQAYTAMYFVILGPFGLYVMSKSDVWYFNIDAMYEGFPHKTNTGLFKSYYLFQAAYWAQQAIVMLLMLEKPRKDFRELVAHHIITLSLIWLSYRFHFTKIGLPVFVTHDISDFFLATSIVLNKIDSPITIPFFITFIGNWVYLRHYQNIRILLSMFPLHSLLPEHINAHVSHTYSVLMVAINPFIMTVTKISPATGALILRVLHDPWPESKFASIGPFELNWETQQYKAPISQWIAFGLLSGLQALNLFWLGLVLRSLWRIVRTFGKETVDERSECDSDEEYAAETVKQSRS